MVIEEFSRPGDDLAYLEWLQAHPWATSLTLAVAAIGISGFISPVAWVDTPRTLPGDASQSSAASGGVPMAISALPEPPRPPREQT